MNEFRIIFLCSSRLALPCLQQLVYSGMAAAVVVPAHCDEMVENVQFVLQKTNIPVIIVDKKNYTSEIITAIEKYNITLGLMVTFSFLIPAAVYQLPKQGFYNIHPGPLPQYRGADPIFQQIKNREKQAGITIHLLSEKFDTGPVVMQEMIRLKQTDTYGLLTSKLGEAAARMLLTLLKLISFETAIPQRLQDESSARYFKKHIAPDVSLQWEQMNATEMVALIHACNPWNKGATTQLNGKIIRLLEAEILAGYSSSEPIPPGVIIAFQENKMMVSTYNNTALIVSLIYMDEGFLFAGRLQDMGVQPGARFRNIVL